MMVYEAETLETVRKIVEDDVYYTGNVVSLRSTTVMIQVTEVSACSGTRRSSSSCLGCQHIRSHRLDLHKW